jgi:flap endonuclease-1
MSLYQFLIQVRSGPEAEVLTNEAGEVTSHLQGMFHRTIRMLNSGIKPCFVFDGKPPQLKSNELAKRFAKREDAAESLAEAKDEENQEDVEKYTKRLVKVTKEHNDDAKKLLRLMGVPIIEAPGEAEAQCAALVSADLVYATATEDMDALTFGTKKLLRHLTFSQARGEPIVEIDLAIILRDMKLTMDQFIDLCILCGCDYTQSIRGIGPMTALKLIRENQSIENAVKKLDFDKHKIPEDFMYKEAADLFRKPLVTDPAELKLNWVQPDEEGLIQFLVNEKGFNLERVQGALKRLKAAQGKATQQRMEGFFKITAPPSSQVEAHKAALKRKQDEEAKKKKLSGKKTGGKPVSAPEPKKQKKK